MEIAFLPRWLLSLFISSDVKRYELNILLSNVIIIICFFLFKNNVLNLINSIPHVCIFKKTTGIDCPFCGTTRAFCEIANYNLNSAISLNAVSIFIIIYFFIQIPLRLFSLIYDQYSGSISKFSSFSNKLFLIFFLFNWIFNLLF
jgi:hypothetical protein